MTANHKGVIVSQLAAFCARTVDAAPGTALVDIKVGTCGVARTNGDGQGGKPKSRRMDGPRPR